MCGIIGYIGQDNATRIVIDGLKKLEYRGYDSWGIAYQEENLKEVKIFRQIGKISDNNDVFPASHLAIGHTRWATHGGVAEKNAHPQISNNEEIILVQNGIVENYQTLRQSLIEKGYVFSSETDTEVIVNLVEEYLKNNSFMEAVRKAALDLAGRNAIVVLNKTTGELIAVRNGSPLIVGISADGYFIASDISAFLEKTNIVEYLDDNQMAVLNGGVRFYNLNTNEPLEKRQVAIDWNIHDAEKGEYAYFMIKEIMEQKDTIRRTLSQDDREIVKIANMIRRAYGTYVVACGTAAHASMVGIYQFAAITGKHLNFSYGSEFNSCGKFLQPDSLLIVTSQSGETVDVIEAMEVAHKKSAKVISLVNSIGSTIARKADYNFYINAGPEKAVASTKAATSQIALYTLLAFAAAGRLEQGKKLLIETAAAVNDLLNPRYENHIKSLAEKFYASDHLYVIGRGVAYPVSLEIALKIKEISYIHAEGMAGGELKHGTLALISAGTPVLAIVLNDENKAAILSNAMEIKARGGKIIGIATENNDIFDDFIRIPDCHEASPLVSLLPGQILAYYLALLRGHNPDKPRNLAKSVTVK